MLSVLRKSYAVENASACVCRVLCSMRLAMDYVWFNNLINKYSLYYRHAATAAS